MRTDKQVHELLAATPELALILAGKPSPGPCTYESLTLKEVERRLDGLVRPVDAQQPEVVVEVQFYRDKFIYERTLGELFQVRRQHPARTVEGMILFAGRDLDQRAHLGRRMVQVVYLDEALRKLARREPRHPAVAAFGPLLTKDVVQVAKKCGLWYRIIKESSASNEAQRAVYERVFHSWLWKRLEKTRWGDLSMLITDMPDIDLEETRIYRQILAKGEAKGEARGKAKGEVLGKAKGEAAAALAILLGLGRRFWGPEPVDLSKELRRLRAPRLKELAQHVPDFPNWKALRATLKK